MKIFNFEVFADQQQAIVSYENGYEEILIIADFHDCEDCFFYDGISGCSRAAFDTSWLLNKFKSVSFVNFEVFTDFSSLNRW